MPIRVNPIHRLGQCKLTLESVMQICSRVVRDFPEARFSAKDDFWEVYDESEERFIEAVSVRERLESFSVVAQSQTPRRRLELLFDQQEATATFVADEDQIDWFKHFLIDVEGYVGPPSIRQRWRRSARGAGQSFGSGRISDPAPYSRISFRDPSPNSLVENIKGNIASNLIWTIMVFILGVVFYAFSAWVLARFGVDINPFDAATIPAPASFDASSTPTPVP